MTLNFIRWNKSNVVVKQSYRDMNFIKACLVRCSLVCAAIYLAALTQSDSFSCSTPITGLSLLLHNQFSSRLSTNENQNSFTTFTKTTESTLRLAATKSFGQKKKKVCFHWSQQWNQQFYWIYVCFARMMDYALHYLYVVHIFLMNHQVLIVETLLRGQLIDGECFHYRTLQSIVGKTQTFSMKENI